MSIPLLNAADGAYHGLVQGYHGLIFVNGGFEIRQDGHIMKHEAFSHHEAYWPVVSPFDKAPAFSSFIQAISWYKKHKTELL